MGNKQVVAPTVPPNSVEVFAHDGCAELGGPDICCTCMNTPHFDENEIMDTRLARHLTPPQFKSGLEQAYSMVGYGVLMSRNVRGSLWHVVEVCVGC